MPLRSSAAGQHAPVAARRRRWPPAQPLTRRARQCGPPRPSYKTSRGSPGSSQSRPRGRISDDVIAQPLGSQDRYRAHLGSAHPDESNRLADARRSRPGRDRPTRSDPPPTPCRQFLQNGSPARAFPRNIVGRHRGTTRTARSCRAICWRYPSIPCAYCG